MNSRELLKQFLEQRREMGESEFVLDSLTVADALRALGAHAEPAVEAIQEPDRPPAARDHYRKEPPPHSAAPPAIRERAPADVEVDWREALRAAGAAPEIRAKIPAATDAPSDAPSDAVAQMHADAPIGNVPEPTRDEPMQKIVIGSSSRELFGGPLNAVASLDAIRALVAECKACPLYATALNPVPGEGNPDADFVCVGEAPGATEDQTGKPFIGRAGELLTKILGAVNLTRDDVFICNVLKHRPPGNRNPAPDEITACRPYLMRQLELIKPKVILALGTFAAQTLLESKLPIGKLRGQAHTFYGIPLVVTYHPAALLRNPAWKRPTWEDVQLARRILDRPSNGT